MYGRRFHALESMHSDSLSLWETQSKAVCLVRDTRHIKHEHLEINAGLLIAIQKSRKIEGPTKQLLTDHMTQLIAESPISQNTDHWIRRNMEKNISSSSNILTDWVLLSEHIIFKMKLVCYFVFEGSGLNGISKSHSGFCPDRSTTELALTHK